MTLETALAYHGPEGRAAGRSARRAGPWLAAVGTFYFLVQAVLVVPGSGLAWDETVYTSQVSGSVPAAFFSAPRARGVSLLVAPIAEVTNSTLGLRLWMAALSGAGLFLALWVWRTLVPLPVLTLAGGLLATLWITVFYGPQVMPNLWSAYGALAAVGCFLRVARRPGDRWAVAGVVLGVSLTGLMRPPDAVWLVLPLAVVALFVPGGRRPLLWAALAAGIALGCGEWVVEAYVRYGGLTERLHRASAIQGGTGWNFAVDDQIRSLGGRTLCRPCTGPWRNKVAAVWFLVLPPAAVAGTVVAIRSGHRAGALLPPLVASSLAIPYLFLIDYAAPRFLLPSYALLAVPVGYGLWAAATAARGRWRPVAIGLTAAALCAHLAVQFGVVRHVSDQNRAMRRAYQAVAGSLHQAGVRPPCLVTGDQAVPAAFYAGCASRETGGADGSITEAGVVAAARFRPAAVLVAAHQQPPAYARSWRPLTLPGSSWFAGYHAYLAPRP